MYLEDYFGTFPDRFDDELRTAAFFSGEGESSPFPDGKYAFFEYYCCDLSCDCRRVLIKVRRVIEGKELRLEEVATIGYSWDESSSDESWRTTMLDIPNPHLDPLNYQASYADEMMEFWHDMVVDDKRYAQRLVRHYEEIRAELGRPGSDSGGDMGAVLNRRDSPAFQTPDEMRQARRNRNRQLQRKLSR